MEEQKNENRFVNWLKTSITARMLVVGFLTLILLIPLSFIDSLIRERKFRQQDVVNEINDKWGKEVLVYGPILKLPYKSIKETKNYNEKTKTYSTSTETVTKYAYIFPDELHANAKINSDKLKRGNYESAVYTSTMNFKGNFKTIDLSLKDIKNDAIIWKKASFIVKTSNLKGIRGELNINIDTTQYAFETIFNTRRKVRLEDEEYYPNYDVGLNDLESSFIKKEHLPTKENPMSFDFSINYNGSKSLQIIPIGKSTTMQMTSNWSNPSFTGEFLPNPETKSITKEGFSADWNVSHLNRAFTQQYLNTIPNLKEFAFGTNFIIPVDQYQQSERSSKYGFLVIGLTFLIFFLIQTLSKINIHPFQYLMIGLALVMFYTLLISISEHSNFLKAYVIAGASVVSLITFYSRSILKGLKFPIFIAASLTALYTFIYVIIQLENYALLVGSIGLFLILATVMFVSRKIDWNTGLA